LYQATGGSGEYIWSSNNLDTTSVNVRGEITTGNLGQSVVTAADTRNQAHKGSVTVSNNTDLFHYVYLHVPVQSEWRDLHVKEILLKMTLSVYNP
jgi:hypothetical protein